MSTAATAAEVLADRPAFRPRRVPVGSEAYNQVAEFLFEEALLLDEIRLIEWTERLAEDLVYTCPMRVTRALSEQQATVVRTVKHFDETYMSIRARVGRLTQTKSAWAEDPPSRTRRLVTNILVEATDDPNEFEVSSYLLLTRSRFEDIDFHFFSGVRRDLLRRVDGAFKLARREIIPDQSVLGVQNLAIFL
ncbi:MAG: aromatic-ring-hydroxylating dioxygenase beta subunit [Phenylobacterium sp.]|nr:aromatic-ring-hydroxylating dioxygenase beta subunit [Phenylobacterium sp.]